MLLADLGAEVFTVAGGRAGDAIPELSRGKHFITLDLKIDAAREALLRLIDAADVLVEGFRPGVADRLGVGWEAVSARNPRLVYCSLTGYGQTGKRAQEAGHDINYLAVSGVLGALGPAGGPPQPPLNIVADLAAGSMLAAFGILAALIERNTSGRGQYVDVSMVEGARSLLAMVYPLWGTPVMPSRGEGLFNAPFYRCYACADGRYVAVGAFERGFFETLWQAVGSGPTPDHMDTRQWPFIASTLEVAFATRPMADWGARFVGSNACVTPVLAPDEAVMEAGEPTGGATPAPVVPRFSRTPGQARPVDLDDATADVLKQIGLTADEIAAVVATEEAPRKTGIDWPPVFGT
ncbi:CaiB/BaiF CoA-transferase family protein [Bosea sp. (in: a-proteobacteria)]|uniref:CaiB/BaiF CoA transferase family protein n=1 Tax=Bosea sp. (in: a-proteobacteria) TaxID=1871050 RepID=UPI0026059DF6|nr:CaiB/BaiF CoA-transferase family protein [Bosea sp. (in: a-proteobacteria)]MCO5089749.1 CoA transferase [Bosea sp. (in: a-proteobacteria)]